MKAKPIRDMRALGKLGGRPPLGDKVSVSVFRVCRSEPRNESYDTLQIRVGHVLALKLGWKPGSKVLVLMTPDKSRLNLRLDPTGTPLRRAGRTLRLEQTVTGVLPPMQARQVVPVAVDGRLSIPITA